MTNSFPLPPNERNVRPLHLGDFIGQAHIKRALNIMLHSAKVRGATLEHLAFYGNAGLGKTTLAAIIANEMGSQLHEVAAPALKDFSDLIKILDRLAPNDVLFLDEIHALRADLAETLYSALEDFKVTKKTLGEDNRSKALVTEEIAPFTLVGSTTDLGKLPGPMLARFGQRFLLRPYTKSELSAILSRAALKFGYLTDEPGLMALAVRAHGTPRVALRLLRRCIDVAVSVQADFIDEELVETTMDILGTDPLGLEDVDRLYLSTLVQVYGGGPASAQAISANAGLDVTTAQRLTEPTLLQLGLIKRTPDGRRVTKKGLNHYQTHIA